MGTHAAVHARRMRKNQSVDSMIGADEDDDVVQGLVDGDSTSQDAAVGELQSDTIIQQVGVQRLLHQLHCVP